MFSTNEIQRFRGCMTARRSVAGKFTVLVVLAGLLSPISATAESGPDLVFAFGSNPGPIEAFDASGAPLYGVELSPRGLARFDHSGTLLVRQGHFKVGQAGPLWAQTLSAANGFTVEIVAASASAPIQQPGVLLRLESSGAGPLLDFVQSGAQLVATLNLGPPGASASVPLGSVSPGTDFHATVVYDGHKLRGYMNGSPTETRDAAAIAATAQVSPELFLGGALDGGVDWSGSIKGVALYRKAWGAAAVAEHARVALEKVSKASPVETLVVEAELVGKSPVPTLAQLAPYTQSLAVYEYKVEKIQAGALESKKLYVVHWSILDSTRLPFAEVSAGGRYTLFLERFEDQPQLQSENLSDSIVDDFSLPWFYDAGGTSLGFDTIAEITAATMKTTSIAPVSPGGPAPAPLAPPLADAREARARDIAAVKEQLAAQVARAGGYPAWTASLAPFREAIRRNAGSHNRYTIVGLEKHLFARSGTDYLMDTDLVQMPMPPNQRAAALPIEIIAGFNRQLESRGIDLIYIPIPTREEVYPDKLSAACPAHHLVSPQLTQFMEALVEAGVEVVDLREAFLDERTKHDELLYPISDVHWGSYAIRRAAAEMAPRLSRYTAAGTSTLVEYSEKTIRITNQGNLVRSLPEAAKAGYLPFEQDVVQVMAPDGILYRDVESSPVLVMGDSFAMHFDEIGGSLSAHLAKELGFPVSNVPSRGGGPKVPRILAAKGPEYLAERRVVVWVMVSRYLGDSYAGEWESPPALE